MPRNASGPLWPARTVTGTAWSPRCTLRWMRSPGRWATTSGRTWAAVVDRVPVDRGDEVALLEVVVRGAAALDVGDDDPVAEVRDRVAEAGQPHLLGRVLGVDHQEGVEPGVGGVRRAADHVLFALDAVVAIQARVRVGVEVGVLGGDLDGEVQEPPGVTVGGDAGHGDDVGAEGGGGAGRDDDVRDVDDRGGDRGDDQDPAEQRRHDLEDPASAAPGPCRGGRRGRRVHHGFPAPLAWSILVA